MTTGFEHDPAGLKQTGGPDEKSEIDRAVNEAMSGLSLDALLAQMSAPTAPAEKQAKRPQRGGRPQAGEPSAADIAVQGRLRRGKIVAVRDRSVFVDLGGKSQGIVPLDQFIPDDPEKPEESTAPGTEYEFNYVGYDEREGLVLLSRRGAVMHGGIEQLHEGDIVEGTVSGANKGGLEVKINNIRAFMPAGQVDVRFTADLNSLIGQKIKCRIIQLDRTARNLVVSRRAILEEEQAGQREKTWSELATGQIREGVVSSVQPYGAFVDLGGVDGLLHVSAMSHTRVSDPSKIVKPGDKIQVMVLSVDRETQRVSLGLKQLTRDPWSTVGENFPVGTTLTVKVTKVMDFGAFVELTPGVEGLIHISELSNKRIGHPREVVEVDKQIQAKVIGVDPEKKKVSLSVAQHLRETSAQSAQTSTPAASNTPAELVKPSVAPKNKALKGGL
ncbi:MAG TPA: S1 RNA-binding domain-containing protein [Phycisphaerae bacterium]|nr:S1 RNA-binding domain-containing protein [Phycisphaerae bacterium]